MKNQRGIALLVAVLIVSLVVTISTVINTYLSIDLELVKFMITSDELQGYSGEIEAEFMRDFRKDSRNIVKKIDQGKYFSNGIFSYKSLNINKFQVSGEVIEQYGLFNLNYLYDPSVCAVDPQNKNKTNPKLDIMRATFKGLIDAALEKTEENFDSERLVENTQKWLCPGNSAELNQAYLRKNPSYVHAGQPFVSITELKLVDGITEKLWEAMKDYLAAWPISSYDEIAFNPATIRPQILAAMSGRVIDDVKDAIKRYISANSDSSMSKSNAEMELILDSSNYIGLQKTKKDKDDFQNVVKSKLFKDTKSLFNTGYKFLVVSKTKKTSNLLALYTMLSIKRNDFSVLWRSRSSY